MPKFTISEYVEAEVREKKSRFIAQISPCQTEKEALSFIADVKKKHSQARHNVYAYILEDGTARYTDDREPHHTAGLPVLEVLKHANLQNISCVVTRYFGGVLLGTGGLVRAYSSAVKEALICAEEQEFIIEDIKMQECTTYCTYSDLEAVKTKLIFQGAKSLKFTYGESVVISYLLPE